MSHVTIKMLRKDLPMWSWTAHRRGFGDWYYVGELAFSRVEVRAYAQLCGPSDDDFATIWRVSEGEHSESFATFWLRWAGDGPQTDRERREGETSMITRIVDWWMKRCRHAGENVVADIAEGDLAMPVRYCRRCGAVALGNRQWRLPEPTWCAP